MNSVKTYTSSVEYNRKIAKFSIIIPTKNRNPHLCSLISAIKKNIPHDISTEIIVIENSDESQEQKSMYTSSNKFDPFDESENSSYVFDDDSIPLRFVNSKHADKISALINGIESSSGENIIIMNDDFSHPPQTIPSMMERLLNNRGSMVVASRYAKGGSVVGRSFLRKLLSNAAVKIVGHIFKLDIKDPISRYIAFPKYLIDGTQLSEDGYTLSLELLVKISGLNVIEVPYVYVENPNSKSITFSSITGYVRSVLHLYKSGPKSTGRNLNYKKSILFLSKAGRFYTVGASGLLINYLISSFASNVLVSGIWYIQATLIGIVVSILSNFVLNKIWTFEDRDFSFSHTFRQFILFVGISSFGAAMQLVLVYVLVESGLRYEISLVFAVSLASISNFLLNKKLTFKDKIWG